ncbi:MAG: sulfotransferase family protein [Pseudomonadota bacterium]
MTLEVIGAGFGRTGTASLKAALEILGYDKTHHMFEVMADKRQMELWHKIGTQPDTPLDWDAVYAGFPAAVDFPTAAYWRELSAYYPEAKVILTVRSADSWWKSASSTIIAIGRAAPTWARALIPPIRQNVEMTNGTVWHRIFDGRQFEETHAKRMFEEHNAAVKAELPSERLLVYEVKQGWEPLCTFLGKPVPAQPFPHENDTAEFKKMIRNIKSGFAIFHALLALAVIGALWAVFG